VVVGGDPVTQHVDRLGLTAEPGRELLRDEDIGAVGDLEAAVDRVVVGDRHEVHSATLGELVDLLRWCAALRQAERPLDAELRELGGGRVTVHVDRGGPGNHRCSLF
jgi:hypothetical protein